MRVRDCLKRCWSGAAAVRNCLALTSVASIPVLIAFVAWGCVGVVSGRLIPSLVGGVLVLVPVVGSVRWSGVFVLDPVN